MATSPATTPTATATPSRSTPSRTRRAARSTSTAGTVTFTPTADLCGDGAGSFDYLVVDGNGGSDAGHVTVDITCVDDAPVANDDTVTVAQDSSANDVTATLLDNDTDPEHDTLSVSGIASDAGGTADLLAGVVTFTPATDVCGDGAGSFDYTVNDGHGGTDDGHVTVNITCTPNTPPVATDDAVSGDEDTDLVLSRVDLVGNDNDDDGDDLSVTSLANPVGGTTALVAGTTTFTPNADICGTGAGSFDYTVDDGNAGTDTGHVVINLACSNDDPVADDDAGGMVSKGSAGADYNVLANDTDVDGDSMTVTLVSVDPGQGTATIVGTGSNTKVHFVPAAAFEGQAIVTYTAQRRHGGTDTGDLTVTVGPDVTAPIVGTPTVVFGGGRVNETAPLRINWLAFDPASGVASYQVQVSVGGRRVRDDLQRPGHVGPQGLPVPQDPGVPRPGHRPCRQRVGLESSATRKIAAIQNSNKHIAYKAAWTGVRLPASSGMGYSYSSKLHDRASVSFIGRSVLYVAPKTKLSGHVKVYVDGTLVGRYNLHARTTKLGRIVVMVAWGAKGTHRIRIVNDTAGKPDEPRRLHRPQVGVSPSPLPTPPAPPAASFVAAPSGPLRCWLAPPPSSRSPTEDSRDHARRARSHDRRPGSPRPRSGPMARAIRGCRLLRCCPAAAELPASPPAPSSSPSATVSRSR